MRQFYTYLHCKPNGQPFYLGKGTGKRAHDFINGRNRHYMRVLSKHGKSNILVFVFPCESEQQALSDEIQQIAQLRREGVALVNMCDGGEGASGHVQSAEHVAKRIAGSFGNKANLGRVFSPEHRAKIGAAHRHKMVSAKTREKLADAGRRDAKGFIQRMAIARAGKVWPRRSDEIKAKISASQKVRWANIRDKVNHA